MSVRQAEGKVIVSWQSRAVGLLRASAVFFTMGGAREPFLIQGVDENTSELEECLEKDVQLLLVPMAAT